ncbi:MAG: alpha/beta fold hydrolase [Minisyncoccia bacterium]
MIEEKETIIDNLKINYKIAGKNPVILILHGWGKGSETWKTIQEILEKEGLENISLDLPGFGKSQEPQNIWGIEDFSKFILHFIDVLNLRKIILIGHSFGGQIALKFSILFPERIEKLILISPATLRNKNKKLNIRKKIAETLLKFKNFLPKFLQKSNIIKKIIYKISGATDYYLASDMMKEIFKKITKEDLENDLEKINNKTLILWGKRDKILPYKNGIFLNEKIKNSKLILIENCSHSPHLEYPEEFSKIILNFIKE